MKNNVDFNIDAIGYRIMGGRVNSFCSRYVDIAIDNYYTLWYKYVEIKNNAFIDRDETRTAEIALENAMFVVVVFSAMAIESYINDYAAGCLGDDEFYDSFDKLNVLDKLRLIVQFIFQKEFIKNQPVYTHIKKLMTDRNELVHNKSEDYHEYCKRKGYTSPESMEEAECLFGASNSLLDDMDSYLDKQSIQNEIDMAKNAIRALRELALFIDKNDPVENACFRLLGADFFKNDMSEQEKKKLEIYRQFQIPTHMK